MVVVLPIHGSFFVPLKASIKSFSSIIVHAWSSSSHRPRTKLTIVPAVLENVEPLDLARPHKAAVEQCCLPEVGSELKLKAIIMAELNNADIIVLGSTMRNNIRLGFQTVDDFHMSYAPKYTLTHGGERKNHQTSDQQSIHVCILYIR